VVCEKWYCPHLPKLGFPRHSCGEKCWSEKKRFTLHHIRLAAADHLDIPFQEVTSVQLGMDRAFSRRLQAAMVERAVFLKIQIRSNRVDNSHAENFKRNFSATTEDASELIDMRVQQLVLAQSNAATTVNNAELTANPDPYAPAYWDF